MFETSGEQTSIRPHFRDMNEKLGRGNHEKVKRNIR